MAITSAIYHFSVRDISRAKGGSASASLAYATGLRVRDEELGRTYDYSRKERVQAVQTFLPEGAPEEYQDPRRLVVSLEAACTRRNAHTAKMVVVALPQGMSLVEQEETVGQWVRAELTGHGFPAVAAWHTDPEGRNPHCHILIANRRLTRSGRWASLEKKVYARDSQGNRIPRIDPATGRQKLDKHNRKQWKQTTVASNPLNRKETLLRWRKAWEEVLNRHLPSRLQVSCLSNRARGIQAAPTIHEGYAARAIEARGGHSWRMDANRQIVASNRRLERLGQALARLGSEITRLGQAIQARVRQLVHDLPWKREQSGNQAHEREAARILLRRERDVERRKLQDRYLALDEKIHTRGKQVSASLNGNASVRLPEQYEQAIQAGRQFDHALQTRGLLHGHRVRKAWVEYRNALQNAGIAPQSLEQPSSEQEATSLRKHVSQALTGRLTAPLRADQESLASRIRSLSQPFTAEEIDAKARTLTPQQARQVETSITHAHKMPAHTRVQAGEQSIEQAIKAASTRGADGRLRLTGSAIRRIIEQESRAAQNRENPARQSRSQREEDSPDLGGPSL